MIKGKIISTTCQYSRQSKSIIQCLSGETLHAVNIPTSLLVTHHSCSVCSTLTHLWRPSSNVMPLWHQPQLSKLSSHCLSKSTLYMYLPLYLFPFILLYLSRPQQIWELLKDRVWYVIQSFTQYSYHTGSLADFKCTLKKLANQTD